MHWWTGRLIPHATGSSIAGTLGASFLACLCCRRPSFSVSFSFSFGSRPQRIQVHTRHNPPSGTHPLTHTYTVARCHSAVRLGHYLQTRTRKIELGRRNHGPWHRPPTITKPLLAAWDTLLALVSKPALLACQACSAASIRLPWVMRPVGWL